MNDRELMQQALNALEYAADQTKPENLHGCDCLICKTILSLRDRLSQPQQEPVEQQNRVLQRALSAMESAYYILMIQPHTPREEAEELRRAMLEIEDVLE